MAVLVKRRARRALQWAALATFALALMLGMAGHGSEEGRPPTAEEKQIAAEKRRQTKRIGRLLGHLIYIFVLTFFSAVFAGLTLGVMCADTFTLEVIAESGPAPDCTYAATILPLRKKGHRTLCTLIVSNMLLNVLIAEEFTKVFNLVHVMRVSAAGGAYIEDHSAIWSFVVSTLFILIFAEIIPMSICKSKASLRVAAAGTPIVKAAMVLTYPVAAPLGKVLDWAVGSEDAGQIYDRKELRKLMVMHYEREESTAIVAKSELKMLLAALDFQERTVKDIMTPIEKVTCVEETDLVTPDFLAQIWLSGRSRIPVRSKEGTINNVLLARDLMTIGRRADYEDALTVADVVRQNNRIFAMVSESTNLPTMLKFFQDAKTHMAFVFTESVAEGSAPAEPAVLSSTLRDSSSPFEMDADMIIVGIVTMEDVVEELLNDEIYDEYDRYEGVGKELTDTAESPVSPSNSSRTGPPVPVEPRVPPRVNFFSYFTHPEANEKLTEAQVWAAAYFLGRTVTCFFAWAPPYIKMLLDECGDEQLTPPLSTAVQCSEQLSSPMESSVSLHWHPDFQSAGRNQDILRGGHEYFLSQAHDESFVLYSRGVRSEVFTLILGGQVDVLVGKEGFFSKLRSFNSLGEQALTRDFCVPDYSAIARAPARCYRIHKRLYDKYLSFQSPSQLNDHRVHVMSSPATKALRLRADTQSSENLHYSPETLPLASRRSARSDGNIYGTFGQ